nr:MAG TPA: hypothetical protein [Caudoviricetes sp.]
MFGPVPILTTTRRGFCSAAVFLRKDLFYENRKRTEN